MAPTVTPVLVYDRIAQNRRKTVLLVIVAILAIVPFVAGISFAAAAYTVSRFGHHTATQAQIDQFRSEITERAPGEVRTEFDSQVEHEIDEYATKMQQERSDNIRLLWKLTIVFSLGVLSVMGLLFWSMASSPTSSVLTMLGARPAGPAESECKRLLENLAIGAGLPTPRLYVIDTAAPNAFAAGMDPAHSVVAVTQGLLTLLDGRELEGVLAHEISHIGNRDTRLNTVVTSIALFLRLPYLLRQQRKRALRQSGASWDPIASRYRIMWTIAMFPIYVYVFFIAPLVASVVRAAISRSREFQADADAALLTRYPEGLLRALAKVRGAGSAIAGPNAVISHLYFSDPSNAVGLMSIANMLATHPPIEVRIKRLMEFNNGVPMSVLEAAARTGVEFARNHPAMALPGTTATAAQNELSVLTNGTPMGRVFRTLTDTVLFDQPDPKSPTLTRIKAGSLVVVFDDPGKYRQVLTHDQIFGYMPPGVKMQRVDMMPSEIHDPEARESAERSRVAAEAVAASAPARGATGLTSQQLAITAVFGVVLFAGIFLALWKFGGN